MATSAWSPEEEKADGEQRTTWKIGRPYGIGKVVSFLASDQTYVSAELTSMGGVVSNLNAAVGLCSVFEKAGRTET